MSEKASFRKAIIIRFDFDLRQSLMSRYSKNSLELASQTDWLVWGKDLKEDMKDERIFRCYLLELANP